MELLAQLLESDHLLALLSIQDAAAAGGSAARTAHDLEQLARGDEAALEGRFVQALQCYRNAWLQSPRLRIATAPGGSSDIRLSLHEASGQRYLVQASTNLVDWITVGTCTPNSKGNATFTDRVRKETGAVFYRVIDAAD
jgi:hypothetical protein